MTAHAWAIDLGGPALSRKVRLRIAREFEEALVDPEPKRPETAIVTAATRWYCSLELPRNEDELWNGPPLWERVRPEPIMIQLENSERDAVYELALECLGSIEDAAPLRDREPEDKRVPPDDLRQVLCDLGETGCGVVEIRIERIGDARRVFGGLAAIAGRREAAIVQRVCWRILDTIDKRQGRPAPVPRDYV